MAYALLLLAIVFLTVSQILQKTVAMRADDSAGYLSAVARQPLFWGALTTLGIGMLLWLLVLSQVEVSTAFPFLSLTFVLTTLFARWKFNETVSIRRWLGVCSICAGVALIGVT